MALVVSTGDAVLAAGATTETGGALPRAEDSAVGLVTVTPVEAEMPTVAVVDIVAVAAASTAAAVPIVVVDAASAAVDVPLVVADAPSVEGGMVEVEVEAVPTVVGAGRLHH